MIINPIELCSLSVADPEGAAPSLQYPPNKILIWAFLCSRKHHFKPQILTFFRMSMTPDPCKAHKRMTVAAVCVLEIIVNKLVSIAESTAHTMRCQLMPTLCPDLCLFVCVASKCINSRCSCARRQMGCS